MFGRKAEAVPPPPTVQPIIQPKKEPEVVVKPQTLSITRHIRAAYSGLSTPVKYEELNKESKSVLTTLDMFDGFKFDLTKMISEKDPSFLVNHSIAMGSVIDPASYNFACNFVGGSTQMHGRIDTDGNCMGRFIQEVNKNLILRLSGQATQEPHNSACNAEVDYRGSYWFGSFKWQNPGSYNLSYMQSITPKLSAGMETVYVAKQGVSGIGFGGRYDTENFTATGMLAAGFLTTSYTQKVSRDVNLSTEFQANLQSGSLETTWSGGFEYTLRSSHFKAHLDSNFKVYAILEEMLNQFTRISVAAELDHKKKNYRFGLGVSMTV